MITDNGNNLVLIEATMECNHQSDSLIGHLLDTEEIILTIATFLSAKDCLALHTVSRRLNGVMSKHSKSLFDDHLRRDFPEGGVLSYVANKKNLSRKKLYRAFVGRWSLPKQADETLRVAEPRYFDRGDRNTKIKTTWTRSLTLSDADDRYERTEILINDDVDNVVFIASLGGGGENFSALMEWNSEFNFDNRWYEDQTTYDQLIIDKSWSDDTGIVPFLPDSGDIGEVTLSLHAIDTRYYQVASVMENTPMDESFYERDRPQLNVWYGFQLPSLFGIPPETSPYHDQVEERDFDTVIKDLGLGDIYPRLEYMTIAGRLRIAVSANGVEWNETGAEDAEWNESEKEYELDHPWKGLNFNFTGLGLGDMGMPGHMECSVDQPHEICSFLSTLMKERCIQIEPRPSLHIAVISEQPEWVQADKIIDTITSFVPLEDQARKLRLVCRKFGLSALRQIQAKLDQNKAIGFMKCLSVSETETLFRATVRRGWSDDFESKESVVDDALWLASCRCRLDCCEGKKGCGHVGKHLSFQSYGSNSIEHVTRTIDLETLRQHLSDKGSVCLHSFDTVMNDKDNSLSCSYRHEEMTLFQLFGQIAQKIAVETRSYGILDFALHGDLKRDYGDLKRIYGVLNNIRVEGFVRSILLPFATTMTMYKDHVLQSSEGPREKKARISPSPTNVTIGEAKSSVITKNGCISRWKSIYRFFSADNEPIEVRLDHSFSEFKFKYMGTSLE